MNAQSAVALLSGLLFGAGLVLAGMTDPARVLGFLDLAGRWDPTLAFVMGSAVLVTLPTFRLLRGRQRPVLAARFYLPTRKDLDPALIGGAAIFGIGWGIAGLCPGPAIANLGTAAPEILAFVVSMVVGMALHDRVRKRSTAPPPPPAAQS